MTLKEKEGACMTVSMNIYIYIKNKSVMFRIVPGIPERSAP